MKRCGRFRRCDGCGGVGRVARFETTTNRREECHCGSDNIENRKYIQPSGFAVDIRTGRPNSSEDQQVFVPPTNPRVTCSGDWLSLSNPELGRFRYAPDGRVFHHSRGATEFGYAVCLECGRAASEEGWHDQGAVVPFDAARRTTHSPKTRTT